MTDQWSNDHVTGQGYAAVKKKAYLPVSDEIWAQASKQKLLRPLLIDGKGLVEQKVSNVPAAFELWAYNIALTFGQLM